MKRIAIRARLGVAAVSCLALAACGGSSGNGASGGSAASNPSSGSKTPIVIGADLSLTGDFASEGVPFSQGYKLWVKDVNAQGGLLGHPVKLDLLSDASNQAQLLSNYQKLITVDHATFLLGPVSTLFTVPAAKIAQRFGYALVEGAGGGPVVFSSGLHNVFYTGLPIANSAVPFAQWVAALPASKRPKTVAYATSTDPFAQPQIGPAQKVLSAAGIKTVLNKVFPVEQSDYTPIADDIAASKAQLVILGAGDLPTLTPFIHAFVQQGYNPEAFYTAGGADQGSDLTKAVGVGNVDGIVGPGGWSPNFPDADSQRMVQNYLKTYGGSASNINSTVAEGYSVGEVLAAAVKATHSLKNNAVMQYLHGGAQIETVLGPVAFNSLGENTKATAFTFQWQNHAWTQVIPSLNGSTVTYPKPAWGK